MNDKLIFLKTASGEEAVRDRTRLVQRNLRMVLILVDGLTDVGTLKQKAGDPVMIEAALAELERIGLIESTVDRTTRQASSVAEAIAIIDPVEAEELPVLEEVAEAVDYPIADTVFEALTPDEQALSGRVEPTSAAGPLEVSPVGVEEPGGHARKEPVASGWVSGVRDRWTQMREERAFEQAYGKPDRVLGAAAVSSRLSNQRPLRLGPKIAGALLLLLGLGIATAHFYPQSEYRVPLQTALNHLLGGEAASVGKVDIAYLPRPAMVLSDVTAGHEGDVHVDTLTLVLSPQLLMGGAYFDGVEAKGLTLRSSLIGRLPEVFPPQEPGAWRPASIKVQDLVLNLGWTQVTGIAGTIAIAAEGGVSGFSGLASDGHVKITAHPSKDGLALEVQANDWLMPLNPAPQISSLNVSGVLRPKQLEIGKCDARALNGLIDCSGEFSWHGAPSGKVDLVLKRLAAAEVLAALQASASLEGEIDGRLQWQANPPLRGWLTGNARLEGPLTLPRGRIKRIDLSGALRNRGLGNGPRGGDTSFEELSGRLAIDAETVRLTGVKLSSGLLTATGQVAINRATAALTGTADVNLQGAAGMRGQVAFAGTSQAPTIKTVP